MKNVLSLATLLLIISFTAFSQEDQSNDETAYPNIVKINPISFAFGNLNISYERALSSSSSVQFGINYWYRILGEEVRGFGVRGGYRFFLTGRSERVKAPEGFYVGPLLSFNSLKDRNSDESATAFGVGAMIGYQWVWASGIALDVGAGPVYQFAQETSSGTSYEGFLPNITIALGYNF